MVKPTTLKPNSLAALVRRLRGRESYRDAAERIGVKFPTLYSLEQGRAVVPSWLTALADFLHCDWVLVPRRKK